MRIFPTLFFAAAAFGSAGGAAGAFSLGFDWDELELCTSGRPNIVENPRFVLENVPEGTRYIGFQMQDLDVPDYPHGGGIVAYRGQRVIEPGAFTYRSPCPPNGVHMYEWTATALSRKNGGMLARATARLPYP